jgi:chemotaxis protein MotB
MSEPSPQTRKSNSGGGHGSLPPLQLDHRKHEEDGGEGNWLVSYADMMTLLVGFFVILLSFSVIDPKKFDEARKSITMEFGGKYQIPYANLADSLRDLAKKLGIGDQLIIKESDIGIEISSRGTVFFDTGSAELKEEAKSLLEKIVEAIKSEPTHFNITVEGHTDDVPFSSGHIIRNNFELSSLRACRVLESFISAGYPTDHLTAVGYGETRPLVPNRDDQGKAIAENQAQNRRVVIKILRPQEPVLPPPPDQEPAASPPPPDQEK